MADLTTLDPNSPPDNELVSNGANRMREERGDLIGWAGIEHYLDGAHHFPQGDGSFPALPSVPAPGNSGRIFMDTVNGRLLRDNGGIWTLLRMSSFNSSIVAFDQVIGTSPVITLTINMNYAANCVVLVLAVVFGYTVGAGTRFTGKIVRDGVTAFPFPGLQTSFEFPDSNTRSFIVVGQDFVGVGGATAGTHQVSVSLQSNASAGLHTTGSYIAALVL